MEEVTGGMRLALRHWRELAGTTLIFALVCFALSFILGDVIVEVGVLRGGATVRREGATTFACFYPPLRPVSDTSPRLLDMLSEKIEEGRAYSSVIGNLEADSPEDFDAKTILVVGGRARSLFSDLGLTSTTPGAFLGTKVEQTSPFVRLRGKEIPVAGRLRGGAVWFDPSSAGIDLDSCQVLQVTPAEFSGLGTIAQEELVLRAVFFDVSDDFIEEYIAEAAKGELYLVPQHIAVVQPRGFAALMVRASLYLISTVAFFALALFSFCASTNEILRQERRAFAIRRMCGATKVALAVRLASFLAVGVLALPVPSCLALTLLGPPVGTGALAALLSILLVYVALLCVFLRRVFPGRE